MLNPAYITEALGKERPVREKAGDDVSSQPRRKFGGEERINHKLKQCYKARTQIKPFYSGGKISVLDDNQFVCQYGPSIKVIHKADTVKLEDKTETNEANDFKPAFFTSKNIEVDLDDIISFDACPVSRVVVTAHKSNLLRIWCLFSGQLLRTIKSLHSMPIGNIEICKAQSLKDIKLNLQESSDELEAIEKTRMQLCWVTVSGVSVKLWQLGGNQMSKLIRIENITSLGYVRWDSTTFYGAERDIYIMGINPETNQFGVLRTLEGHYSQVTGIEITDKLMLSGGRDKVLIIWDLENDYDKLKTIPFPNSIEGLFLSLPNDLFIAVNPSNVFHFNIQNFKLSKNPVLSLSENETVTTFHPPALSSTPEVNSALISSHTGTIYEVIKIKEEDKKVKLSIVHQYVGDLDEVLCAVLWTDGKVAVANNTNVIKVYDLSTGSCDFLRGHKDIVLSLSCNKEWMVSSSKDNQIIYWKSSSLEPQAVLSGHLASVTSVCFNPGKDVVYSVSEDRFLKSWNKERLLSGVVAHDKEINAVHCSPNGAMISTASRDKTAKIWDAESLQLIATFKGHKKGVWDARFSSWDQLVATASADTTIKIWSLSSKECIQVLQGHLSSVLQVQFINMGLQLLSVSSDGSLKSWELKTSSCLLTEECGNDKIWTLDASPDGGIVVTGSADSVLTLWHDVTEQKVSDAVDKKKKLVKDEQKLSNLLNSKEWARAFDIALQLDRPFTLLKIIRDVSDVGMFRPVIEKLEDDKLLHLLNYVTKWNTNTKTSTEAQMLLNMIIRTFPEDHLSRLIQPMHVLSYTEKHHERVYRMMRQMSFLQFIANEHGAVEQS